MRDLFQPHEGARVISRAMGVLGGAVALTAWTLVQRDGEPLATVAMA